MYDLRKSSKINDKETYLPRNKILLDSFSTPNEAFIVQSNGILWDRDYVYTETDVLAMFICTPQMSVDPIEGTAVIP